MVTMALVTCAPAAAPVATPSAIPTSNFPPPTSQTATQDAAWAKVVAAAKKEGKLTAYSFNWVGDVGLTVQKAFESRYGIKLDIITGRGSEFIERIKTERRVQQQVGDFTEGSPLHIQSMKLNGSLASIVSELPVIKEQGVWLAEPTVIDTQDKVNLVWRFEVLSPYMNTKLVKPEDAPGSWKDLLDPKWVGKMSIGDPNIQSTFSRVAVVFMENGVWNEDYVKALYKQKPGFTTGGADDFSRLSRGEVSLVICGAEATAAKFIVEGAPIQPIDMRDGVVFSTGSMAAIAGSPNPNATKVFINWVLSQEGQTVTSKAQSIKVLRKDVADFRAKGAQVQYTRPLVESIQHLEKSTRMFQEKWFDKLVGR